MEAMSSTVAAAREKAISRLLRYASRAGFCLIIPLLALILSAAVPSTAAAHSASGTSLHNLQAAQALEPDVECCADLADHHSVDFCSTSGHCGACAAENPKAGSHEAALAGRIRATLTVLPAGLSSGPAGHPPKTA